MKRTIKELESIGEFVLADRFRRTVMGTSSKIVMKHFGGKYPPWEFSPEYRVGWIVLTRDECYDVFGESNLPRDPNAEIEWNGYAVIDGKKIPFAINDYRKRGRNWNVFSDSPDVLTALQEYASKKLNRRVKIRRDESSPVNK